MSKLGAILVREGRLSESDRRTIRRESRSFRGSFSRSVLALGILDEEALATVFASNTTFRRAPKPLKDSVESEVLGLIPAPILKWFDVIPLKRVHGRLHVAMVDPTDREVISQLEFFLGSDVQPVIASLSSIRKALDYHYSAVQDFSAGEFEEFLGHYRPNSVRVSSVAQKSSPVRTVSNEAPDWSTDEFGEEESSTMSDDSGGELMDDYAAAPLEAEETVQSPQDIPVEPLQASISRDLDPSGMTGESPPSQDQPPKNDLGIDETDLEQPADAELGELSAAGSEADAPGIEEPATEEPAIEVPEESEGVQLDAAEVSLFDDISAMPELSDNDLSLDGDVALGIVKDELPSVTQEEDVLSDEPSDQQIDMLSPYIDAVEVDEIDIPLVESHSDEPIPMVATPAHPGIAKVNHCLIKMSLLSEIEQVQSQFVKVSIEVGVDSGLLMGLSEGGLKPIFMWYKTEDGLNTTRELPPGIDLDRAKSWSQELSKLESWGSLEEVISGQIDEMNASWPGQEYPLTHGFVQSRPDSSTVALVRFEGESLHPGLMACYQNLVMAVARKVI